MNYSVTSIFIVIKKGIVIKMREEIMKILKTNGSTSLEEVNDVEKKLHINFPQDYIDFILKYNGATGTVNNSYIDMWKIEDIIKKNSDYRVDDFFPNLVYFGSNGKNTAYAFDKNENMSIIEVPLITKNIEDDKKIIGTFGEFLGSLCATYDNLNINTTQNKNIFKQFIFIGICIIIISFLGVGASSNKNIRSILSLLFFASIIFTITSLICYIIKKNEPKKNIINNVIAFDDSIKCINFIPYKRVDNIIWGENRRKIIKVLGKPIRRVKVGYPIRNHYCDDYEYMHIYYNEKGNVDAINIFPENLKFKNYFIEYNYIKIKLTSDVDYFVKELKK